MIICQDDIYREMTREEEDILKQVLRPLSLPSYKERVTQRIREKYSVEDEIAIIRQKDVKPEEYQEWYDFVEQIKAGEKAKENIL